MNKRKRSKLLQNARAYDFCLEVKDVRFKALLDSLYSELRKVGHFSGRINAADQKRDLGMLILNVLKAEQSGFNPYSRLSLRKASYARGRYNPTNISFGGTDRAFKALVAEQYVKMNIGYRKPKSGLPKQTRYRCRKKLRSLFDSYGAYGWSIRICPNSETVLLRDGSADKKLIPYFDTPQTIQWRENLEKINLVLEEAWIDLYVRDKELERINEILNRDKDKQPIDFSRKRLRRIFNNGKWDEGGRFYHGWWQEIPSEYREYITINDKETVEVDFSGMHPLMLYAKYTGKAYHNDPYDIHAVPRSTAKVVFNILINSQDKKRATGAVRDRLKRDGLASDSRAVKDVVNQILTKHDPIKTAFMSGEGVKLQFLDSQIAEELMLTFLGGRVPILPVHDSFIMHHGYRNELADAMEETFNKVMGIKPRTKLAANAWEMMPEKVGPSKPVEIMFEEDSLEDIIDINNDPYSEYYTRGREYGFL